MTPTRALLTLTRVIFSKNIFILFLIISAAYLTGLLWFERISSNRSFFYTLAEAMTPTPAMPIGFELPFVEPMRIVTGFANMSYSVDYLTEAPASSHTALAALRSAYLSASYSHTSDLYWPDILASVSYILDYSFRVPHDLVAGAWGVRDSAITRHVNGFNSIVISPGITSADGISITFVDSPAGQAHHFRLDDDPFRASLRSEITAAQGQDTDILFSASSEVASHMFEGNAFIPIFSGDAYTYAPLRATNPYANASGDVLMSSLLPRVSAFFETPAAITSKVNPGVFIFSDQHTVVRFSSYNILEYSNYHTSRQTRSLTLGEAYGLARTFISSDAQVAGRTFLEEFLEDDGTFVFLFGLAAYNFPIITPTSLRYLHDLHTPIEVTVRGGSVTNYRKWALNFERTNLESTATLGFFGAYDNLLDARAYSGAPTPYINNAILAFYPSLYNLDEVTLVWDLQFDGISYIEPTHIYDP
ncbi:MAG: hypothetical protein FWE20_06035 [Defluviitaleaceae bacterium]|nr:hypothetical protein [Defluviitaleaceae bacterium]